MHRKTNIIHIEKGMDAFVSKLKLTIHFKDQEKMKKKCCKEASKGKLLHITHMTGLSKELLR